MGTGRILAFDDDPRFLHSISELLICAGYDLYCTVDSLPTLEMAEAIKPDLIILDISMPGKNGVEIARDLAESPKTRASRVMFLTAQRAADHVNNAKAAGGAAYLEKPIRSSSLLWMARPLLSGGPERKAKAQ